VYYEELALEVSASIAGLRVLKPPFMRGESGIEHKFSFVATDESTKYAFDVWQNVSEIEVLRTYIKALDTGAHAIIVCLSGKPSAEGKKLAEEYRLEVLTPGDVGNFFSKRITQQIRATSRAN
jgi:predicted RecB family endonuclease